MTANQIAWWNIQENTRSHQQNELNERNKQSITESLGEEQNRISNMKMKNDFVLGQQGNNINQMQANTAATRAAQDYAVGLGTLRNQERRNANDYEIGTTGNAIKATDVSNNYILGQSGQRIQSIRNAQDYALGLREQDSKARQAEASMLTASSNFGKLNPAQIVVALAAPGAQQGATAITKVIAEKGPKVVKNLLTQDKPAVSPTTGNSLSTVKLTKAQTVVATSPRATGGVPVKPKPDKPSGVTKPKPGNATKAYRR